MRSLNQPERVAADARHVRIDRRQTCGDRHRRFQRIAAILGLQGNPVPWRLPGAFLSSVDTAGGYVFFANMVKRSDGKVYADLPKTDGCVYLSHEDAQAAIDSDPATAPHRHVVQMCAVVWGGQ